MSKGRYKEWLTEKNLNLIRAWKADGLTDLEIAKNIGICEDTFYEWKKKYAEFAEAVTYGRAEADYIVQNEAFQSCKDRIVKIKKPVKVRRVRYNEKGYKVEEWEEVVEVECEEVIPANVLAQQFWLRNRRPERFADGRIKVPEKDGSEEALNELCDAIKQGAGDGK